MPLHTQLQARSGQRSPRMPKRWGWPAGTSRSWRWTSSASSHRTTTRDTIRPYIGLHSSLNPAYNVLPITNANAMLPPKRYTWQLCVCLELSFSKCLVDWLQGECVHRRYQTLPQAVFVLSQEQWQDLLSKHRRPSPREALCQSTRWEGLLPTAKWRPCHVRPTDLLLPFHGADGRAEETRERHPCSQLDQICIPLRSRQWSGTSQARPSLLSGASSEAPPRANWVCR